MSELPNLYGDGQRYHELSNEHTWPDELIEERITEYSDFISTDDKMPRATTEAQRLLGHFVFESMYRAGAFKKKRPRSHK